MGETKMCQTSVPYFSDLIIMSFICSHCGAHSTETKTSKAIGEYGTKITIKPDKNDLTRDLFKSDTCSVQIP
jgi:zinc finger protein